MTEEAPPGSEVDPSVLEDLRVNLGDEVVARVVMAYLNALPARVAALRAAADEGGPALRDAAHALTASSRAVGASGLGDLCAEAERCAASGDHQTAAAAARQACEASGHVRDRLAALHG